MGWCDVGGANFCAIALTESWAVPCHRHAYGEPAFRTGKEANPASQWNYSALVFFLHMLFITDFMAIIVIGHN